MNDRYAEVAVLTGSPQRGSFTYAVPEGMDLRRGMSVVVPWRSRWALGIVLEVAPTLGLRIQEGRYRPEFLYEADECFVTSSGVGILPVATIDGHPFPKHTTRSWVAILQARYEHLLRTQSR